MGFFSGAIGNQVLDGVKKVVVQFATTARLNGGPETDLQVLEDAFGLSREGCAAFAKAAALLAPLAKVYADKYLPKHIDIAVDAAVKTLEAHVEPAS